MHGLNKAGIALAIVGIAAMAVLAAVLNVENVETFTRAWTKIILMSAGGLAVLGVILQAQKK